jgi:hypothetical protein
MSKQRYDNIQSALLQNEQDSSKNASDESKVRAEINQLQMESKRIDGQWIYHNKTVSANINSKLENLKKMQQETNKIEQDLLLAKSPKEIMEKFLLDYSEHKTEKVIIGDSHNPIELQNSLENKFANLDEEL